LLLSKSITDTVGEGDPENKMNVASVWQAVYKIAYVFHQHYKVMQAYITVFKGTEEGKGKVC